MRTHLATGCIAEYEDRGRGRPVVLLHAFPLDKQMWRPQIEALSERYRLIAADYRGFGGTSGLISTIDELADDLAALLEALSVREPVMVCGLSMGGYIALAFARRYSDRLAALILADTRAEPDSPEGRAGRDQMIEFAGTHPAGDVLEQMLPRLISSQTLANRPDAVQEIRRIASAQSSAAFVAALRALRDRPDARPGLSAIRVPTLVVVGADDAVTPPSAADLLAATIPGASRVVIPGAGHLSNIERPEEFTAAVEAFLASL
jgi:pimeloyl-ACP methyl ester carboxylesterase